jgi:hypothetical protein
MAALIDYTNVRNTALLIAKQKGFQVWYDRQTDEYCAEKEGWDFRSPSAAGLLGLIAIYEFKQPPAYSEYWWRVDGPELFPELPNAPEREYWPVGRPR